MQNYPTLTPEKALIFRITHRNNLPWILDHGLHCASSGIHDPSFTAIGKPDLIERRHRKPVPEPPGGTLADYVPFYFAPKTPMLYNIRTGQGVRQQANTDIVFLVSSLEKLTQHGVQFLFTDYHAVTDLARFSGSLSDLVGLPWSDLCAANFKRDPDDPGRFERYQAEALAFRHVPLDALLAVACYSDDVQAWLKREIEGRRLTVRTVVRTGWYFP
jgi:ssDNA thymidine ADP-ribosyltransferase, DarT